MKITFEVSYGYEGGCFGGKLPLTILEAAWDEYQRRSQDWDLAELRITMIIKMPGIKDPFKVIVHDKNGAHLPPVRKPGPQAA